MSVVSPIFTNALAATWRTAKYSSFNASKSAGMAIESPISSNVFAAP